MGDYHEEEIPLDPVEEVSDTRDVSVCACVLMRVCVRIAHTKARVDISILLQGLTMSDVCYRRSISGSKNSLPRMKCSMWSTASTSTWES